MSKRDISWKTGFHAREALLQGMLFWAQAREEAHTNLVPYEFR